MPKLNKEALDAYKNQKPANQENYINIGMSACGIAAGAGEVYDVFSEEVKRRNLSVEVRKCGCIGKCFAEPMVEVRIEGLPTVYYGKVTPDIALKILDKHILGKKLVNDHIYSLKIE